MISSNLISILDLSKQQQVEIFELAQKGDMLFEMYRHSLEGKVLSSLFFNPVPGHNLAFSQHLSASGDSILVVRI